MECWMLLIPFLYLTLHVSNNSAFNTQTVDVKDTVTLPCKGAVSKDTPPQKNDIKWVAGENILVVLYQQGELTVGDWFKGRVNISEDDIRFGNFSLKISPVEYSDGDLYKCYWNETYLDDVKLEVLVPREVRARIGEPATLPCYFHVDKIKKINVDTAHWEKDGLICGRWKKDGQSVLANQSGLFNKSCGCENRCSMSVERFRFGDLSLNISEVRHSDQGTYRCFSTEKTEKTIKPDEIILITEVHYNTTVIQRGQSLWLQLYSSEPVRVVFQPIKNSSTVPVCTVKGESADCVPQYQDRVSIQNTTLKLNSVIPLDNGMYRVMDHKTNQTISSVTVCVSDPPGIMWPWGLVLGLVLVLVLAVGLVNRHPCHTQMQAVFRDHIEDDFEPMREMEPLAPDQPVQENGEVEQLRIPVCETGDTEDKRGPQPWNDS